MYPAKLQPLSFPQLQKQYSCLQLHVQLNHAKSCILPWISARGYGSYNDKTPMLLLYKIK